MSERYGLDWHKEDYMRLEFLMACIEAEGVKHAREARKSKHRL